MTAWAQRAAAKERRSAEVLETMATTKMSALDASRPVGDGEYCVQQGECLESIAFSRRLNWKQIWDDPRNAALKQTRSPNILLPGDRLYVPDLETKSFDAVTDRRHTFVLEGVWSRLHIRVVEWIQADVEQQHDTADPVGTDGSSAGHEPNKAALQARPRAHVPYVLTIDKAQWFSGRTDSDGWIDHAVSPGAQQGELLLEPGTERAYKLQLLLGGLDPIAAHSGICQRLANLGFCPCADLQSGSPEFQDAVRAFQTANGLESTGLLDQETRARLNDIHGS
jgi:hypothetical protein